MPTGWSANNTPDTKHNACYAVTGIVDSQKRLSAQGEAKFQGSANGAPSVLELLLAYHSGSASSAYQTIVTQLDACKTFAETIDGQAVTGTLGALSLGSFGDRSAAFQATLSIPGATLG
jgi:hypothetical protein